MHNVQIRVWTVPIRTPLIVARPQRRASSLERNPILSRRRFRRRCEENDGSSVLSEQLTQRSKELENVVINVQSLIAQETPETTPSRTQIREQIAACLKELHKKLGDIRAVMEETPDAENMKKFADLESELLSLKREVTELKQRLMELNAARLGSDLDACMKQLDAISFFDISCFTSEEKQQLEEMFIAFKDITRIGDDGAVWLMNLINQVKEIKDTRKPADAEAVHTVEKETLAQIVDIYRTLFPPEDDAAETWTQSVEARTIVQEQIQETEDRLKDVGTSERWKKIPPVSRSEVPETSDGNGGGGSGDAGDGNSGGGDGSSGDGSNAGFTGWELITILLIYFIVLAFVLIIRNILAERRRQAELASIPPEPEKSKKRRKRNR